MIKLAYVPLQNFGDQLNPWIWKQLLGESIDVSEDNCYHDHIQAKVSLLSIGSYLTHSRLDRFTSNNKAVVAGTGCGYGLFRKSYSCGVNFPFKTKLLYKLPVTQRSRYTDSKRFYWVRGPLSAHVLGLPKETAVADAAYLIRQLPPIAISPQRKGVAFMPHVSSAQFVLWKDLCELIGFTFIDPRESLPSVMKKIAEAEVLVTDALHGAIVSDALRTPWIPIRTSQAILEFKWRDYCSSININYQPIDIPALWSPSLIMKPQGRRYKILFGIRAILSNFNLSKEKVAKELFYAAYSNPYLSNDETISIIDEKLGERLHQLKADMDNNSFFLE